MDYIGFVITGLGVAYSLFALYTIFRDDDGEDGRFSPPPSPSTNDERTPLLSSVDDDVEIRQRSNNPSEKDSDEEFIKGWDMV